MYVSFIDISTLLIYTGNQRFSSNITKVISKQILENKSDSLLSEMAIATNEAKKLFKSSSLDLNVFADLMNYNWERKKKFLIKY